MSSRPCVLNLCSVGVCLVKAACIADADGVCIVVYSMASAHVDRPTLFYRSIKAYIEMVADVFHLSVFGVNVSRKLPGLVCSVD